MNNKAPQDLIKVWHHHNGLLLREFNTSQQAELFATLKQLQFSGQLVLTEPKGGKWIFHLYQGYLVYATGGIHPVKRWSRNLATYLPQLAGDLSTFSSELSEIAAEDFVVCWQYQLLSLWIQQQKITREQATRIIWSTLVEVLFDITQTGKIAYELKPARSLSGKIVLIDAERVVAEAERQWLAWQAVKLVGCDPNQAPIVKQPDQLQQSTSASMSQMLSQLLDGQQTLRDITIKMKRELPIVTRSLLPYIQSGLVELINIPDLPAPIVSASAPAKIKQPSIACVDDSPLICQSLEQLLSSAGYRFVGIDDPLRAFGVLLALKPDLIFLDLMMPNTNGYEICDRLRKINIFRHTPIVILTGNDGIVDRVRAKIVGASDFLSKAKVDAESVLEVLEKHLKHSTLSKLTSNNFSPVGQAKKIA
jgi:chemotaxis family two-component system response regulator PixG